MFNSTPVRRFSSSPNAPFTSISCYLLFISTEGKSYFTSISVFPVSFSAIPVTWPLPRYHGGLISVMLIPKLHGTEKKDQSLASYEQLHREPP